MIKKLLNLSLAGLLLMSTLVTAIPAQAFAKQDDKPEKTESLVVPGNNGTLKVHEFGTPSGTEPVPGTENTDPKVCKFNLEGFNFDQGQEGYVQIAIQGGQDNGTVVRTLDFGPADTVVAGEPGYYAETVYVDDLPEDLYKATLYGKDTGGNIDLTDEKAKSKNFKVDCEDTEVLTAIAAVDTTPATCFAGEKLVYDAATWTNATVDASSDPSGTEGPGSYEVIANATAGAEFSAGVTTQSFTGDLDAKLTGRECQTVFAEPCETKATLLVTNDNEQGFNYSPMGTPYADTRTDGDYEYVDGALRLTTLNPVDSSSTNKVSGARTVEIPLREYGGSFAMNFTPSYGTILPGINIRVDADNDGDTDVTLVAEPGVPGYDTFWTNTPGYLPANGGGQGGAYSGDQDDFLLNYPNAVVRVEAFALGSGVGTDGDLISWSTPCNTYTYDYVAPRVLEASASVDVTEGDCEAPGRLTYDVNSWLNSVLLGGSTPTGTTGPASYTVTAQATQNAEFSNGTDTLVFSGNLDAQLTGDDCVLGENPETPETPEVPETPVVEDTPEVLPATSSSESFTSLLFAITAFVGLMALGTHLIRSSLSRSL